MKTDNSYEWRKQLMWGLVLVGAGITMFLNQADLVDLHDLWHYWPLLMVVFGINKMIGYPTAKHYTSGLWSVLVGVWLFATFEHMFGLTLHNSWPFFIIAGGVCMIIEPVIQRRFAPNEEQRNEK